MKISSHCMVFPSSKRPQDNIEADISRLKDKLVSNVIVIPAEALGSCIRACPSIYPGHGQNLRASYASDVALYHYSHQYSPLLLPIPPEV